MPSTILLRSGTCTKLPGFTERLPGSYVKPDPIPCEREAVRTVQRIDGSYTNRQNCRLYFLYIIGAPACFSSLSSESKTGRQVASACALRASADRQLAVYFLLKSSGRSSVG